MKRPGILIFSLGLNVILATTIVWAIHRRNAATPPETVISKVGGNKASSNIAPMAATESAPALTNEVTAPFSWSAVESTDYLAYRDNLRAIGCPEQRIRDIIIADVDALFAGRARDYVAPLQSRFWEIASRPRDAEKVFKEHEAALDKMDEERKQIFQELFGETNPHRSARDARRQVSRNANKDSLLDFLAEAKRAGVRAIQDELASALSAVRNEQFTGTSAEKRKQREAKEREIRSTTEEKMKALLTSEEFAEYKLRNSSGAAVRYQVARMTLSETEARQIAQAIADKTEASAKLEAKDPATKTAKAQLDELAQTEIKKLLGDTRYAEYQRASDGRYTETARVIERLQLPEQTAVAIYQARLEAEKLATKLRADNSASTEERNAALEVLRVEAENSVRQLVGDKAFKDYQNNSGGWLNGLAQPGR